MTLHRLAAAALLAATMAAAPHAQAQTSQDFTAKPNPSGEIECDAGSGAVWQATALGADGGPTAKYRHYVACFGNEAQCTTWAQRRTGNFARIVQARCHQR